jgi:phospholipid/cholesterol/gamma-HCH transport system substrate-binding protein
LKEGSAGFKTLMDKANEVDDILLAIKSTIENTSKITDDLSKITNNIQSGNGTIGKLLMDKSSGEDFDSTMANLKEGSAELKLLLEKAQDSWLLGGF